MKSFMQEYGLLVVAILVVAFLTGMVIIFNSNMSDNTDTAYNDLYDYSTESIDGVSVAGGDTDNNATEEVLGAGLYDADGNLIRTLTLEETGTGARGVAALLTHGAMKVILPNGVISIDGSAFYECTNLLTITIPNGVEHINGYAFAGCTNLSSITIPNSVLSIGDCAFADCTYLSSITIPDDVMLIKPGAFKNVPHIYYNGSATGAPWGAKAIN